MAALSVHVADYLDGCRLSLAPATVDSYTWALDHLLVEFSGRSLRFLTPGRLRAWLLALQNSGYGTYSVHSHWRSLRAFLRWCVRLGHLRADPLATVTAPRMPDPAREGLGPEHVRQLLAACGRSPEPVRDRALLVLLLDTGLRRSEAAEVRVRHLDAERRVLTVPIGKGGRGRLVPVSRVAVAALRRWIKAAALESGASLFGLSRYGIGFVIGRLSKLARVDCTPHILRHTFAYLYGGDILDLQLILGHSDVRTTSTIYRHRAVVGLVALHDERSPMARFSEGCAAGV